MVGTCWNHIWTEIKPCPRCRAEHNHREQLTICKPTSVETWTTNAGFSFRQMRTNHMLSCIYLTKRNMIKSDCHPSDLTCLVDLSMHDSQDCSRLVLLIMSCSGLSACYSQPFCGSLQPVACNMRRPGSIIALYPFHPLYSRREASLSRSQGMGCTVLQKDCHVSRQLTRILVGRAPRNNQQTNEPSNQPPSQANPVNTSSTKIEKLWATLGMKFLVSSWMLPCSRSHGSVSPSLHVPSTS